MQLRRGKDLSRCRGGNQPGGQVHRIAEVITVDGQDLAVTETGADLQCGLACPWMVDQVERRLGQPFGAATASASRAMVAPSMRRRPDAASPPNCALNATQVARASTSAWLNVAVSGLDHLVRGEPEVVQIFDQASSLACVGDSSGFQRIEVNHLSKCASPPGDDARR